MGFKYKTYSFTGGDANFPTGTSASDIRTKEESIVKGFAENLIACNCGWALDSNRHSSVTDFFDVPKMSSSTAAPGLFLVNSTSGCKLFITYVDEGNGTTNGMAFYDTDGTTKIMPNDDWVVRRYQSTRPDNPLSLQGFIMSMIPAGSSNDFGQTVNASFLPPEATRLWGSAANIAYSYSYGPFLGTRVGTGTVRKFCVWATPYCVGYGLNHVIYEFYNFLYAVGRIIGDLAFPSADTTVQAKYGVVTFGSSASTIAETYDTNSGFVVLQKQQSIFTKSNNYYTSYDWGETISTNLSYLASESTNGNYALWGFSVCRADGTWASRTSTSFVAPCANNLNFALSNYIFDDTSNNRPWIPFAMCLFSNGSQTDWIYNGSGLKGYLDTDLFRCSYQFATGTKLDNGNFICTYAGNLTLGWDPNNEDW